MPRPVPLGPDDPAVDLFEWTDLEHNAADGSHKSTAVIKPQILDAKGDLISASAADTPAKVTIPNGHIPKRDNAQANGWTSVDPATLGDGGSSGAQFVETFGDGVEDTFTFTHNFGTTAIGAPTVIEVATGDSVLVAWACVDGAGTPSNNHVTIGPLDVVPTLNQYQITIQAGGVSGVTSLAGLTDVNTAGAIDGDALVYDDGTGTWIPGAGGVGGAQFVDLIGDGVSTTITVTHNLGTRNLSLTIREVSTNEFVAARIVANTTNTIQIGPFDIAPTVDQYEVTIQAGGVTGATSLAGLSDTSIASPQFGQELKYNGTDWTNDSLAASSVQTIGTNATITTANIAIARVSHAAMVVGIRLGAGTYAWQTVVVYNESEYPFRFEETESLSLIRGGANLIIPPRSIQSFLWDGARWTTEAKDTISFNPVHFGATFDGVADDSDAFLRMQSAIVNSIRGIPTGASNYRLNVKIQLPPGQCYLTQSATLLGSTVTVPVQGILIEGAGQGATSIYFDPLAADTYLMRNDDRWLNIKVQDVEFLGRSTNANFFFTDRIAQGIQCFDFTNVTWGGTWNYICRSQGVNNNNDWSFNHCVWRITSCLRALSVEETDQSACFTFFDPDILIVGTGDFAVWEMGGNVFVYGGSLMHAGTGTFWRLLGATHAQGACFFSQRGGRYELRENTVKRLECEWPHGSVVFDGIDEGTHASSDPPHVTAIHNFGHSSGPAIAYRNCVLQGQHEYQYASNAYLTNAIVEYVNTRFYDYDEPSGFFVFTAVAATGNLGGKPVVHIDRCRGSGTGIFDSDLNWSVNSRGETTRKILAIKSSHGGFPFAGASIQTKIPLGARIVGARLYSPAFGVSGSTTGTLTLQTNEGTPTVLASVAPNPLSAGFDSTYVNLFFLCDTEEKRTLNLVSNVALDSSTTNSVIFVEYIG